MERNLSSASIDAIATELNKVVTTPFFWDCECKEHYIHGKQDARCPVCGAERDDMPDSIVREVVQALTVNKNMFA
jgi:rubrerythrin